FVVGCVVVVDRQPIGVDERRVGGAYLISPHADFARVEARAAVQIGGDAHRDSGDTATSKTGRNNPEAIVTGSRIHESGIAGEVPWHCPIEIAVGDGVGGTRIIFICSIIPYDTVGQGHMALGRKQAGVTGYGTVYHGRIALRSDMGDSRGKNT